MTDELHRLRRLDDAPAMAWLSGPERLLARHASRAGALLLALVTLGGMSIRTELLLRSATAVTSFSWQIATRLAPYAGAIVVWRLTRWLLVLGQRRLVERAVIRRAGRRARTIDDLAALARLPDGTLVSCVGRVRSRHPFHVRNEQPDERRIAAAVIRFAGPRREDAAEIDTLGRAPAPLLWRRPLTDADDRPDRALLALLTRPAWIDAVFEAGRDFDLVDAGEGGGGSSVAVALADAQLLATPTEWLGGDPRRADALLAELRAPLAAMEASRGRAHLLRDGDAVEVIGFKDTVVAGDAAAEPAGMPGRAPPLRTVLRGREDRPLLVIPIGPRGGARDAA